MRGRHSTLLAVILLGGFTNLGYGAEVQVRPEIYVQRPKWVADEIVVKFKGGVSDERAGRIKSRYQAEEIYTSPYGHFKRLRISAGKKPQEVVKLFNNESDVEYAELNYYAYAHLTPNDPYYWIQWHLYEPQAGINIEPAWNITTGDPNVIIAVLDTGVAYERYKQFYQAPDLASTRFVAGYDFINNDSHPNDDDGHGTHVTGTIAQSTNNNLGVAGVAFNCTIMPVKVLSKRGEAPYTTIADGVYFAANNGANVINMSLGGSYDSAVLRDAVAYAYNHGVTIVCSAGNEYENGNARSYPAGYDQYCIAVGATMFDRTRAPYSNTGSYIDVMAPGGVIGIDQNEDGYDDGVLQQTFGTNYGDFGYWFYTGTSMAAPHVSGVAGLLFSAGVTDPKDIREALENTAGDLGAPGWDEEFGFGLIDANAVLHYFDIPGDFNRDRKVDYLDLAIFADNWLENEPTTDIAPIGGDGTVNFLDFAAFAESWNGR